MSETFNRISLLGKVSGKENKWRVLKGKEPIYNEDDLGLIAGRALVSNPILNKEGHFTGITMYEANYGLIYDAYIDAGVSPEQAKELTDNHFKGPNPSLLN